MNNSIISIDLLPEPKSDSYFMPNYVFDLEFPFSFYFIKKIDSFKTLYEEYEEEMSMLSGETKNMDHDAYKDYIQDFSKRVFNSMMLLDSSPLEDASDLYFKDFVSIICNDETNAEKISVLSISLNVNLVKRIP